jgi:hypothetical protein
MKSVLENEVAEVRKEGMWIISNLFSVNTREVRMHALDTGIVHSFSLGIELFVTAKDVRLIGVFMEGIKNVFETLVEYYTESSQ